MKKWILATILIAIIAFFFAFGITTFVKLVF